MTEKAGRKHKTSGKDMCSYVIPRDAKTPVFFAVALAKVDETMVRKGEKGTLISKTDFS